MWKNYALNAATWNYENGKYLAYVVDNSKITRDEIIESYDEEIKNYSNKF